MKKRKYEESHPWIKFGLDLKEQPLPYTTWVLLGAAQSKCMHLAGIPLRPEKRQELLRVSMIKGVHATTAIEGNSLSEDEIKQINDGISQLPKSKDYQRQEILNVLRVYNDMATRIKRNTSCEITCEQIKLDNKIILDKLKKDESDNDVIPGEIRTHAMYVSKYRGAPAEDCEYLLQKLCDWLQSDWGFDSENKVIEAILKAILGHLYIAWIHPFSDGNGRTARALELRVLMSAGVPADAPHLLSNHYNNTRSEYYYFLGQTSQLDRKNGDPRPFIEYAVQGLVDALDEQIKIILEEEIQVTWINFIHSKFGGRLTFVQKRQRDLLLEISNFENPVDLSDLRKRLSEDLIAQYGDTTPRAFRRDINALIKLGLLLKKEGNKVLAAKELLISYLPISKMRPEL